MKHYLLTGEKWIPVLFRDGSFAELSLLELFSGGRKVSDLAVSPAERIALMRFLLCIVARSLPLPSTRAEWETAQERIAPQAIAYLNKWESAFDLYGEHPFLQAVGLEKEWTTTLDKLDFALASGNNHTLFDHLASKPGRPHSPAWQARMLLVTQNLSPGGTIGPNSWNGVETNELTGNISTPALEGSPLHTFLLGDDIIETLHLNLIAREDLGTMEIGTPVWENPPKDARDAQRFRTTLLGRLTPFSRTIRLPESGEALSLAVGCNYAQISEFVDPYLANRRNAKDQTLSYLPIQAERHPWRELESLLALQVSSSHLVTPPKHLANRYRIPAGKTFRLWCGGVSVDKAKFEFAGEWLIAFSEELLNRNEFWNEFGHFAKAAEEVAVAVRNSIGLFWNNLSKVEMNKNGETEIKIKAGKEKAQFQAVKGYWKRLDTLAAEFFASGAENKEEEFNKLYRQLRETAEEFFYAVLPDQSPRGILARAKTMPYFRKELKRILGEKITEKGEEVNGK